MWPLSGPLFHRDPSPVPCDPIQNVTVPLVLIVLISLFVSSGLELKSPHHIQNSLARVVLCVPLWTCSSVKRHKQRRPSPWDHDAFLPCFRLPPIYEKFSDSDENFNNLTFSRKISWFSSAEISDDLFLSSTTNFDFPHFPCFSTFPPLSRQLLFSPLLWQISPLFDTHHLFYILYVYFVSPLLWPWWIYASPNARTGRPCAKLYVYDYMYSCI